mmetsp:Transcript_67765/g.118837  ORF Transcript_67765/g.118837 Transcript_67765/m.118837 type:complete len:107 (+) Transcript_67765:150-470(+)
MVKPASITIGDHVARLGATTSYDFLNFFSAVGKVKGARLRFPPQVNSFHYNSHLAMASLQLKKLVKGCTIIQELSITEYHDIVMRTVETKGISYVASDFTKIDSIA